MLRVKFFLAVLIALVMSGGGLFIAVSRAQSLTDSGSGSPAGALKLTTSPLPISLVAPPGETVSTPLRVKNGGMVDERLKVGLLKFSAYGETGQPDLKDREVGDDYFDWVSFSETEFTVSPDSWYEITMTVALPPESAFGYYYAVTFSRADLPVANESNLLQGGTAILVLVEARVDNAIRQMSVDEFSATKKVYEFLPAEFRIKLKNSGNIHMPATGNIFIKQGDTTIATLDVNQAGGNVLPNSKRVFTTSWNQGFPSYVPVENNGTVVVDDKGQQVYKLKWDISKVSQLRMGKYTAQLLMSYSEEDRDVPLEATVTFWVIPWRLLAAILVPLALVILLVIKYVKLRKRLKSLKGSGGDQSSKRE